jgi:lactoylglutathione lyase
MELSLEGLTLHVDDVERSLEFYRRMPGAEVLFQRGREFALLRIGRARLGLLGFNAPGFHIEISTADLDHLYRFLSTVGIEPSDPPTVQHWGERTFHVIDPDGNRIEFDTRLGTV